MGSQGFFFNFSRATKGMFACAMCTKIGWILAILVFIAYASSEDSDEPVHPHTLPRAIITEHIHSMAADKYSNHTLDI